MDVRRPVGVRGPAAGLDRWLRAGALASAFLLPMPAFVTDIDAFRESGGVRVHVELASESPVTDGILYRGLTEDFAGAVAVPGSATRVGTGPLDLWDRAPLAEDAPGFYWAQLVDPLNEVWVVGPVTPVAPAPPAVSGLVRLSPNPTAAGATVRFTVGADVAPGGGAVPVRLTVCDARGRPVRTLLAEPRAVGPGEALWDGRDARGRACPPGVYWVRLAAGGRRDARRLVRVR